MTAENPNHSTPPLPDLIDGQFNVVRSDGEVENGWRIKEVYDRSMDDGTVVPTVIIHKDAGDGEHDFVKNIPVDKLRSWQVRPEQSKDSPQGYLGTAAVLGTEGSYDHLFRVEAEKGGLPSDQGFMPEAVRKPRLEMLFAPALTLDQMPPHPPVNYDYLFEKNDTKRQQLVAQAAQQDAERRQKELSYHTVTDESRSAAAERLRLVRQHDSHIDALISSFERQKDITDPAETVDMVRTDADLRYGLGSYLLEDKLPMRIHKMPERIIHNTGKNPKHRGYVHIPGLRSQEYAVLLALSMIDGTFIGAPNGDEIERKNGEVILGQHRAAAEELLY